MLLPFVDWESVSNSANSDLIGLGQALPGSVSLTSLLHTAYSRLQILADQSVPSGEGVGWEDSVGQRAISFLMLL